MSEGTTAVLVPIVLVVLGVIIALVMGRVKSRFRHREPTQSQAYGSHGSRARRAGRGPAGT